MTKFEIFMIYVIPFIFFIGFILAFGILFWSIYNDMTSENSPSHILCKDVCHSNNLEYNNLEFTGFAGKTRVCYCKDINGAISTRLI